jgi:hypothetical protein
MTLEVLAYVAEGWRPLYLIDVKKFNREDNSIPVDGYAEIASPENFEMVSMSGIEFEQPQLVYEFEDEDHQKVNRDFIIRAKRLKGDEWKAMKYKMYRIDE